MTVEAPPVHSDKDSGRDYPGHRPRRPAGAGASEHAYTHAWLGSSSVPDRQRIEDNVMARKKGKKTKKDKKNKDKKAQSAQGAPAAVETAVAPSASPRPKKS